MNTFGANGAPGPCVLELLKPGNAEPGVAMLTPAYLCLNHYNCLAPTLALPYLLLCRITTGHYNT